MSLGSIGLCGFELGLCASQIGLELVGTPGGHAERVCRLVDLFLGHPVGRPGSGCSSSACAFAEDVDAHVEHLCVETLEPDFCLERVLKGSGQGVWLVLSPSPPSSSSSGLGGVRG